MQGQRSRDAMEGPWQGRERTQRERDPGGWGAVSRAWWEARGVAWVTQECGLDGGGTEVLEMPHQLGETRKGLLMRWVTRMQEGKQKCRRTTGLFLEWQVDGHQWKWRDTGKEGSDEFCFE